jgi:hypothetical protein
MSVNRTERDDPPGEFEEIEIAEEELTDAYVRGELSLEERRLLEKGLRNSPQLVERLHFARLLADAADRAAEGEVSLSQRKELSPSRKSWWPFGLTWGSRPAFNLAFAACLLIMFIGGLSFLAGWVRLRRESQELAEKQAVLERQRLELQKSAAEQRLATEQITADLKEKQQKLEADQRRLDELTQALNEKPTASSAIIANLFLLPASRGSGTDKELKVPPGTSKIRLQLSVDSIDYRGFEADVKDPHGKVIFHPTKIRPPRSRTVVTIMIPTKNLTAGVYSVQLSGISPDGTTELVGNYSFRITAERISP